MKKIYVLDTNVFLTNAESIFSFKNNDVIIPLKVLEEIDKHKKRQDGVGLNARHTIRLLDDLRSKGSLYKGVRIAKGKGILSVRGYDPEDLPRGVDIQSPDNEIITTAITEHRKNPKRKVIVVTRDINMRVKCDALQMPTEDYVSEHIVTDTNELYTGFTKCLVDDQIIDRFYSDEEVILEEEEHEKLFPNEFIILVSSTDQKKTGLARYYGRNKPIGKAKDYKKGIWGLFPRNKEQSFGLNLLLDKNISVITMIGKAGCGKTLLAIAAGLEQVLETHIYKKLIVSRPVQPLGKDIGYLPGTLEEKMKPWLAPIQDNIDFLLNGKKSHMEMFFEDGTIEIEALTYIRGRSISNAFIIIDEAQNLTVHELKTIITRVGENTKIILTGDIEQIDNTYLDSTSNGLSYAIEKLKNYEISGHITLMKGERSKVATLAAKIL